MSKSSNSLNIDKTFSSLLLNGPDDFYPQLPKKSPSLDVHGGGKVRKSFCVKENLYVNGNIILDGKILKNNPSNLSSNVLVCNTLCALLKIQSDLIEPKHSGNITLTGNVHLQSFEGNNTKTPAVINENGMIIRGSPMQNTVFVAKNGNDTTGDGSVASPFLTVQHAINIAYTMASTVSPVTTRPVVWVMPGTYTENLTLKANVFIRGHNQNQTRIIGNWTIDSTFTTPLAGNDARAGFNDLFISGTGNVDFASLSSTEGKIMAYNTRFGNSITLNAAGPINQFLCFGCEFFGNFNITGMVVQFVNCISQSGNTVTLNYSSAGGNSFQQCGGCRANVIVNSVLGSYNVTLEGAVISGSTLLVNGTFANINTSSNSLPPIPQISYTNGASSSQFIRENDAFSAAYTPANLSHWSNITPTSISDALDRIAAKITPIP